MNDLDPDRPRRQSSLHAPTRRGAGAAARRRRQQRTVKHDHGFVRVSDPDAPTAQGPRAARARRGADGVPLLTLTVLTVLTLVGLARVQASTRRLDIGAEITELTETRAQLMERKRRLEAERAYLRHPDRIRRQATEELEMHPVEPSRVQHIELLASPAKEPKRD